jgi:hypothetical protein
MGCVPEIGRSVYFGLAPEKARNIQRFWKSGLLAANEDERLAQVAAPQAPELR